MWVDPTLVHSQETDITKGRYTMDDRLITGQTDHYYLYGWSCLSTDLAIVTVAIRKCDSNRKAAKTNVLPPNTKTLYFIFYNWAKLQQSEVTSSYHYHPC